MTRYWIRSRHSILVMLAALGTTACSHGGGSGSAGGDVASKGDSTNADPSAATPVTMAQVERRTIPVTVSAPGQVDAVEDERVRAPFNGTLVSLRVKLGDHVHQGESVGEIVAQNSEAALAGARAMLRSATTPGERADAERALALAERNLVRTPLPAPRTGVVIARPASPGELVAEGDSIISIGATNSMAFFATLAQGELAEIRSGEQALITLASGGRPYHGVVKRVLPSDTGSTGGMRVEIDFIPSSIPLTIGLVGNADITVDEHSNVAAVPASALLRDDVTGTTKIALVTQQNEAQWLVVKPGISDSGWTEIVSPPLRMGTRVITTGQVGLPDSTRVVAITDSSAAESTSYGAGAGTASSGTSAAPNGNGGPAAETAPATGSGAAGGGGARPSTSGGGNPTSNGAPNANSSPSAAAGSQGNQRAAGGDARAGNRTGSPGAAATRAPAAHAPTPGAPATGGARRPDDS